MRGTDCTPEQIAHARQFWIDRGWTAGAEKAVITLDMAARMTAWYGALRFIAGRDGDCGPFEKPNDFYIKEDRMTEPNESIPELTEKEQPAAEASTPDTPAPEEPQAGGDDAHAV